MRTDKARLLTDSRMLLHVLSSMFLSLLHECPVSGVYKHGRLNCLIEYLHRKLLTANFLSYDIESAFIGFSLFKQ